MKLPYKPIALRSRLLLLLLLLLLIIIIILALQSLVDLSVFQNCSPVLSVLCLTPPILYAHLL
jgi:hypothetical protein